VEHNPFIALLLITTLALVVPVIATRLMRIAIPVVVGEILAGIIIGHSGLNLVENSPTLTFLAEFGFAYLMFLSGLEVDFELLFSRNRDAQKRWRAPLPIALLLLTGTIGLAILITFVLAGIIAVKSPLLLGLILSTTSLGVVVPVLKERDLLGSVYGQYLLVIASIADFVTLLLLTVLIAIRSQGLTLDLLLIPVLLALFAIAARITQRFSSRNIIHRILSELSTTTTQIRVRGAFALMVAWVVLAEALGVELILGAFLAGAVAGLVAGPDDNNAKEKLDAIGYGFFIPIFFIMVGVEFNLSALFASRQALVLVPLLLIGAYIVKVIPALLLQRQFSWRQAIGAGFLLSSRLSLIIAAASIALNIGAISEAINAAVILVAVISCTLSPIFFNRIYPPEQEQRREGIIIIGQDQLVEFIVERLLPSQESIVVICPDESRVQAFEKLPVTLITRCSGIADALQQANADHARVLIDLTTTPEETLEACTLSRESYAIPLVISRISDVELIPQLQSLGVKVVQPALATAMALEGALKFPTIFDLLLDQDRDNIDVSEVSLRNIRLSGTPLRQLRLPGDVLILSMQRDESVIVPHGDTVLQIGDRIGLIGSPGALSRAIALLRG
jgi:Kef-type K+ transport system membrane component KefB/Trk K+ transport system NAD-binding subunit